MEENKIYNFLVQFKDEKFKAFSEKSVVSKLELIGVRIPKLRELAKTIEPFDLRENATFEEILLFGLMLAKNKKLEYEQIYDFVKKIDNWAICDCFVSSLQIKKDEKFFKFLVDLINENMQNEFVVRFAIVCFLRWFLPNKVDEIFKLINYIKTDKYYINMASAWCYCEGLIKCYDSTLKYLFNAEKWVKNKAIQKACESYRINEKQKVFLKGLKVKN